MAAQSTEIKLLFAGDIMQHGAQIRAAQTGNNQYDYAPCFKYISPILQTADLVIGNLELTLAPQPPYSGYPLFKSPDTLAHALKSAGFDILTTANNHVNDGHVAGFIHTIDKLEEVNLLQTGTFRNAAERDLHYPLIVYKNGFKIALLNYTYDTNGIPTRSPTVINLLTRPIKNDVTTARKLHADIIVVYLHWGDEYRTQPNQKQVTLAKDLLRWGADLVIGSHPHVVQPIENYTVKRPNGDIDRALVAYSLGNFISNQQRANTDGGLLLETTFTKDSLTQNVSLQSASYLPIWRYIRQENGKSQFYVLPIVAAENQFLPANFLTANAQRSMKQYARNVRLLLKDTPILERK